LKKKAHWPFCKRFGYLAQILVVHILANAQSLWCNKQTDKDGDEGADKLDFSV